MLIKWLHHIFQPHCPECEHEYDCKTCETLRSLLDAERFEKKQILENLLDLTKPVSEVRDNQSQPAMQPIRSSNVPWRVRQQMLEAEDRRSKELRKNNEIEIKDLEDSLGLKSNEN